MKESSEFDEAGVGVVDEGGGCVWYLCGVFCKVCEFSDVEILSFSSNP